MLSFFKRRSPQHRRPYHRAEPLVSREDAAIAKHHGMTEQHWANLPAIVKVDLREEFFTVQGLA